MRYALKFRRILLVWGALVVAVSSSISAVCAETAAFIDFVSLGPGVPKDYNAMVEKKIADELDAIGTKYIDQAKQLPFNKAKYSHILQVAVTPTTIGTRLVVKMFATADDSELFSYPIWLPALPQDWSAQRFMNDHKQLRTKFSSVILPLHAIYRQDRSKPKLFANCIFPPSTSADKNDWEFSRFVTTTYPAALQTDKSLTNYRVFGISPSGFAEWCQPENTDDPLPMAGFEAKVFGNIYRLQGGDTLLLTFQSGDNASVSRAIPISSVLNEMPGRVAATVTGIISEK